ncbi:hypothetical protein ENSA7_59600 [Enhygromyxa salina]|uniref:Uncharacterized protein n=1 Tax=Enhygromyxa salina TaxID=215803 RepID=A0A2S9Y5Y7_9BACT|nr:hypothetical protein ENSA7_59600 [Enhygromyxa salina]
MNSQGRTQSKMTLINSFRNTVRYAMRKMKLDCEQHGVTEAFFNLDAFDQSLRLPVNAEVCGAGGQQASLIDLLTAVRRDPVTFHFAWTRHAVATPHSAAFEMFLTRSGALKVRLLWLALPDMFPVSPRIGIIDGRAPLKEAVFDLLQVRSDGRIEVFPDPA